MQDEKMNGDALPLEDEQVGDAAGGRSDCAPAAAAETDADPIRQIYLHIDSILKDDHVPLQMRLPGDGYREYMEMQKRREQQ